MAIVDDEDFPRVANRGTWRVGAKSHPVRSAEHNRTEKLDRFIVGLAWYDPRIVKHRNGDPLDCQKSNLYITNKHEHPPRLPQSEQDLYRARMLRKRQECAEAGVTWNSPILDVTKEGGQ